MGNKLPILPILFIVFVESVHLLKHIVVLDQQSGGSIVVEQIERHQDSLHARDEILSGERAEKKAKQ